jgi:hypothetical protein
MAASLARWRKGSRFGFPIADCVELRQNRYMLGHPIKRAPAAAALAVCFLLQAPQRTQGQTCLGDIDGDGQVTAADLALAVSIVSGELATPTQKARAEVNGDGIVSAADIVLVVQLQGRCSAGTATPSSARTLSPTPTLSPTLAAVSPTTSPVTTSTPPPTGTMTPTATPTTNAALFSGTISDLVPHGLDDTFNYNIMGPGSLNTTETDKIVSVNANGDFTVDLKQGAAEKQDKYLDTGTQLFFYEEDGVAPAPATTTPCTPALLRLSMPVTAGQTTSTTSTCTIHYPPPTLPTMFSVTETMTPIELLDELTVAAGTFTNVVHIHGTRSYGNETDEVYLAPGVGIIHRVQVQKIGSTTQTITTDLSSATVGGQPVVPK